MGPPVDFNGGLHGLRLYGETSVCGLVGGAQNHENTSQLQL